jgi:lipoprotein-anchoring transpeptidase ErfK/SrfK
MPWAVFFHGGYAVHGTTEIRKLGKPASHGCVRLHPDNAKAFFSLVKDAGLTQSQIVVVE